MSVLASQQEYLDALTRGERRVLDLLLRGFANNEIASELGTSSKTVRNQVTAVLAKFGVASRYQLMALFVSAPRPAAVLDRMARGNTAARGVRV